MEEGGGGGRVDHLVKRRRSSWRRLWGAGQKRIIFVDQTFPLSHICFNLANMSASASKKAIRPTKRFISQTFFGGFWANFMNPFEYGKSLKDKSHPKRIGTLIPLNLRYMEGTICWLLDMLNQTRQIGLRNFRALKKEFCLFSYFNEMY